MHHAERRWRAARGPARGRERQPRVRPHARRAAPPTNPAGQRVSAEASLGELRIPLLPGLPGLPAPPSIPAVTVPGFGSIDLNPAIQALAAPSGDLIGIRALDASVTGQCSSGKPLITSTWSVAGLTVLGVPISTNSAVSRTLTIDSRSIDPSNIDPAAVAPAGVDLSAFSAALRPVLDALPNIAIPEALARLQVTPGQEIRGSNRLTQRALSISLSIAGQSAVDFVAGEATVGGNGVPCGEATATQALRCTSRRLVLIDVVRRKGRVRFLGAADARLAGRRVAIHYLDTGKRVARPLVGKDGLFRASAKLPPRRVRGTNRARYEARLGNDRSLALKLARRLRITSITPKARRVVIAGQITQAAGAPDRAGHRHSSGLVRPRRGRQALQAAQERPLPRDALGCQDAPGRDVPFPHARALQRERPEAVPDLHTAAVRRYRLEPVHAPDEDRRHHRPGLA